jgi:exonuclease SbcD
VKLLVLSDSQIGAGVNLGYGEYGPGSRLNDQLVTATRIAELAHAENVSLVLHAGDVFEQRKPTPAQLDVFAAFLLALEPIPCLAITGNHCRSGTSDVTSLDVFRGYPNFRLSTKPERYSFSGLDVCTLPWAPTSQLIANRNGEREGLNEEAADKLVEIAAGLRAQCSGPAILLTHFWLSGATTATGHGGVINEPVLPVDTLAGLGFDAVFSGHVHKRQELRHNIGHIGCPSRTNYSEEHEITGVFVVDVDDGEVWPRFREIPDRPFVTLDLDVYGTTDHDTCMVQTGDPDVGDAIVRVRYTATPEQARRIDEHAIRSRLLDAGAHKVVSITAEVTSGDRARIPTLTTDLADDEALRLWLDRRGVEEGLDERVCARHGRYGEEVRG